MKSRGPPMLDAEWEGHATEEKLGQLREFSLAWMLFFCALGAWQWIGHNDLTTLAVFCAVGLAVGFVGLARPRTVRPLFSLAMAVTLPIRWIMTRLVLGLLFFGLFTPVGWLFRRLRRDPLRLKKPQIASYWSPAPPPTDAQSYFRQSL
jgi:hypothetical protein